MAPSFTAEKMRFAQRLRDARKTANISQERAALAVGTSRRHWIRWESGETTPNPAYLDRIAEVLGDPTLRDADEDDEEAAPMPLTPDELEMLGDLMGRLARFKKRVLA